MASTFFKDSCHICMSPVLGTLPVITSTVLTRELLLQKNKSRVFSVVSVILVGWDTSCWRNLSAVMFISWLHNRPFNTAVSPVDVG